MSDVLHITYGDQAELATDDRWDAMRAKTRAADVAVGDVVMVDHRRRVVAGVLKHKTLGPRGAEACCTLTFAEAVFPGILSFRPTYIFPPLVQVGPMSAQGAGRVDGAAAPV